MEKGRSLIRWALGAAVVATISLYAIVASGMVENTAAQARADVIVIDGLKSFGDLDTVPVLFLHDKHTDAVEQAGKDCTACHKKDDKGQLSSKFMRFEDGDAKQPVTDLYHQNCISCHEEIAAAGRVSGPVECGGCHSGKTVISSRQPVGLDKYLHFRHADNKQIKPVAGADVNCGACHHEYDKAAKATKWVKDAEGTCRYCHLEADTPAAQAEFAVDTRSMQRASHDACLGCHVEMKTAKIETGPIKCAGCHSLEKQQAVEKPDFIKRMDRKQPDAVLIAAPVDDPKTPVMAPVAFNHKGHEEYNDSCRVCHHEKIESCAKTCHTVKGAKEGDFVQLSEAMHKKDSMQSCLGCHESKKTAPECAGCHTFIPKAKMPTNSCGKCHVELADADAAALKGLTGDNLYKAGQAVAADAVAARSTTAKMYATEDIPEFVEIGTLADEYKPSKLPHRKIVETLYKGVKDNGMAGYFHGDKGTLCQGCHHNSPASKKPPRCASCHGQPFGDDAPGKPGLKAAYHQQCMGCHNAMKLEKPADTKCADCHEKKN